MKNFSLFLLIVMTSVLAAFSTNGLHAQNSNHIPGEFIVMLQSGHSPSEISRQLPYIVHVRVLSTLSNIHLFRLDPGPKAEDSILRTIRSLPNVRAAQFNHHVSERITPNDPFLGSQWHHVDAEDNDIDSDLAWDITTGGTTLAGDEIVVCVLEGGGANYNHIDLIANHWTNDGEIPNNGIDDDANGFIDDYNGWNPQSQSDNIASGGHGTSVSGMIGAKGNNNEGGAGVNWNVKIMQVDMGSLNEANVIAAYSYPQTMRNLYNTSSGQRGAFVVATNASWGIDYADPSDYPVWCAYYDDLGAVGILNCGATANNNVNIDAVGDMPTGCASDYMVAVTATNSDDNRTFSAYGATTIDLAAPGGGVFLPSGSSGYSSTSGTSFASPCVAGAIALVYSAPCFDLAALAASDPQGAADLVRGYIFSGVDPIASLSGITVTGGRLNVRNALDLALADCGNPPSCVPLSFSAVTACVYNENNGMAEAEVTLSASFESNACFADTLHYSVVGESQISIPLSGGNPLANGSDYVLGGLQNNTSYRFWCTTADGNSDTVVVATPDCSAEILGCTDPTALNYNPTATLNDNSCEYSCTDVTLTLTTDCFGEETGWQITDANDSIVASVATYTYGDQTTYTWQGCLDYGCYVFTVFDLFGDGMAGSTYGFCDSDGDYLLTGGGEVLAEMGAADFGSSVSHTFCVDSIDTPPCETPYPQVTGLDHNILTISVQLTWDPVPGSTNCQVKGSKVSGGPVYTFLTNSPESDEFFVYKNQLEAGEQYQWQVRCGCSVQPVIAGPWSEWSYFTLPGSRSADGSDNGVSTPTGLHLMPNPAHDDVRLSYSSTTQGAAIVDVLDIGGRKVRTFNLSQTEGLNAMDIDLRNLPSGIYVLRLNDGMKIRTARIAVE